MSQAGKSDDEIVAAMTAAIMAAIREKRWGTTGWLRCKTFAQRSSVMVSAR